MKNITCAKCKETKPVEDFNKSEALRNYSRCRECIKAYKNAENENKKPRELDLDKTKLSCKTWQGGKYQGCILDKNNTFYPRVAGYQKSFRYTDENKDEIKKLANQWRKEKSNELNLTTNKYKIIYDKKTPLYILIKLSKDYVTLVDFDNLDLVKSHFLCATKGGNENASYYCNATVRGKNKGFHNHITGFKMVDHINGYPLDNRKCNLRDTNYSENNKNKSLIHKTSYSKSKDINNKYEAMIIYNDHTMNFKKVIIKNYSDTEEEATQWIDTKCNEIDSGINKISGRQQLKEEFEKIMEKYSDGFKWRDLIDENISDNDGEIEKETNAMTSENKSSIRNDTYNLFKKIDPNWNMPQEFTISIKLEHIIHENYEYKFCTKCSNWVLVTKFHKSSSKHDGLDTRCVDCAKLQKELRKGNI